MALGRKSDFINSRTCLITWGTETERAVCGNQFPGRTIRLSSWKHINLKRKVANNGIFSYSSLLLPLGFEFQFSYTINLVHSVLLWLAAGIHWYNASRFFSLNCYPSCFYSLERLGNMAANTVLVMKQPWTFLASPALVLNLHLSTAQKKALYAE